jgi:hypothetical protein
MFVSDLWKSTHLRPLRRMVLWGPMFAVLCQIGCSGKLEKSADPAEIEKKRQEHIQTMQREAGGKQIPGQ